MRMSVWIPIAVTALLALLGSVYTVREGARGATGVQGGGCGCN